MSETLLHTLLFAQATAVAAPSPSMADLLSTAIACPLPWAMVLGAIGMWLLLPGEAIRGRAAAYALTAINIAALVAVIWPAFHAASEGLTAPVAAMLGFAALSLVLAGAYLATDRGSLGMLWMLAMAPAVVMAAMTYPGLWMPALAILLMTGVIIILLSPVGARSPKGAGAMLSVAAVVLLGIMAAPTEISDQGGWLFFWMLALLTVFSAVAAISMQSPVYSAIWFGVSLLATAGLFLLQGAQFLSVATVAVYAGAILVTFLFVLMLAQPEGHSYYDRTSWGAFPTIAAVMAAALIVGGLTYRYTHLDSAPLGPDPQATAAALQAGVLHPEHMAKFGGYLFSRHMLSVEAAGSLLLAALVGAVAILIKAREEQTAAAAARTDNAEGGAA